MLINSFPGRMIWKTGLIFLFCLITVSSMASERYHLNIGTDDWPPYEYFENATAKTKITGYSTELILIVLNKLNVVVDHLDIYPWARAENELFRGNIDALYSSSTSKKRRKYCFFPKEPLIESSWVMFIRKKDADRLKFDSLADLKGHKVGVVKDYSYTDEFWSFIHAENNFETVIFEEQNFKKLNVARIDYTVCELGVGMALTKKLNFSGKIIPLKDNPIKVTGLYIMFNKMTVPQKLVDEFSKQLKTYKSTPEFRLLYKKYF